MSLKQVNDTVYNYNIRIAAVEAYLQMLERTNHKEPRRGQAQKEYDDLIAGRKEVLK